jgi:hypothetical protein
MKRLIVTGIINRPKSGMSFLNLKNKITTISRKDFILLYKICLENLKRTEKIILFSLPTLSTGKQFIEGLSYLLGEEKLSGNNFIITLFEFSDDTRFSFPLTKSNNGRHKEKNSFP